MTVTSRRRLRRDLHDPEAGFTLIELLVVVIIIGILAAIAIPVYIGVQNNAKDSSAKSDLINARIALQAYTTANPGSWQALSSSGSTNSASFKDYGWAGSAVVDGSSTAGGSATAYCVKVTSGSTTVFYLTQTVAPTSTKPSGCA